MNVLHQSPHGEIIYIHQKFSFPVACLVFALLAVALGFHTRKEGKLGGLTLGLGVIFLYYSLMAFAESGAKSRDPLVQSALGALVPQPGPRRHRHRRGVVANPGHRPGPCPSGAGLAGPPVHARADGRRPTGGPATHPATVVVIRDSPVCRFPARGCSICTSDASSSVLIGLALRRA